jgi:protein TonB
MNMDAKQIMTADINDIIFENRNKQYGAYDIRKKYEKHVMVAMAIAVAALLLFIFGPKTWELIKPKEVEAPVAEKVVTINELASPPPMDETKPPPPPVEVPPPPKTIQFVPPKIVKEEVVEKPPTIEEIKQAPAVSTQTTDGPVDYTPPPQVAQVIQEKPKEEEIVEFADQTPEFPGGYPAMEKYIQEHIHYPPAAIDANIQGTVYLKFLVSSEGKISAVTILKDIGGGCGEEAKRIVMSMPAWNPGKMNGKPVKTPVQIPVKFILR